MFKILSLVLTSLTIVQIILSDLAKIVKDTEKPALGQDTRFLELLKNLGKCKLKFSYHITWPLKAEILI